ncbi:MAG TPA: hypothetical protein VI685_14845 [Candidatus Angelobacter sp.]
MKKTRTVILTLTFLFALGAFALQSQPGQDNKDEHSRMGQQSIDEHVKMLSEKLNLTDDQQAQAKAILTDQHQQMQSIMDDTSLSQDDKKAKVHSLHEANKAKFRDVLNDDQKKKFDQMQQEMHDHAHAKGNDSNPPK